MLEARDLQATRGDAVLFSALSFSLEPGTLLRVSGANGSGKTTLLRALCGLLAPSAGEIRWRGTPIGTLREEYWRDLLYLGHADGLKPDLTAEENLAVACALGGRAVPIERLRAALAELGLAAHAHLPVRVYSQGQRRRAALARLAVGADTPLWVLDEPFAALDAAAVQQVESLLAAHLGRGGMVVLTTHQEARIAAPSAITVRLGSTA